MQKFFRSLALLCFLLLIFSPLYFKYIKHYFTSSKLELLSATNIMAKFVSNSNSCTAPSTIIFPKSGVQILHFFSLTCSACAKELNIWSEAKFTSDEPLQIIHFTTKSSLSFPESQETLTKLFPKEAGANICLGLINDHELDNLNLGMLPHTFLIKDGKIIQTISGKIDTSDIQKLLNSIKK